MNKADFQLGVLGMANETIPDPCLKFALSWFNGLDKEQYSQVDVAQCIRLARKLSQIKDLVDNESKLIKTLEGFRTDLMEAVILRKDVQVIAAYYDSLHARTRAVYECYLLMEKFKKYLRAVYKVRGFLEDKQDKPELKTIIDPILPLEKEIVANIKRLKRSLVELRGGDNGESQT